MTEIESPPKKRVGPSPVRFRCSMCPEEHKALPGAEYKVVNAAIGALGWRIMPRKPAEPDHDHCLKCPTCAAKHYAEARAS